MKGFFKDYSNLCKESCTFYKKHWKGVILINAVIVAGEFAWLKRDTIKDTIKDKFSKKKIEESWWTLLFIREENTPYYENNKLFTYINGGNYYEN